MHFSLSTKFLLFLFQGMNVTDYFFKIIDLASSHFGFKQICVFYGNVKLLWKWWWLCAFLKLHFPKQRRVSRLEDLCFIYATLA